MKILITISAVFLLCGPRLQALSAETWDEVAVSMETAGRQLADGAPRKEILERFHHCIESNPHSEYHDFASKLCADLARSVEKIEDDQGGKHAGFGNLMDTRFPYGFDFESDFARRVEIDATWEEFMNAHPRDPMTVVLRMDRSVIGSLLPLLNDNSPTRAYRMIGPAHKAGDRECYTPDMSRVCDEALLAIEFHSKCRFNHKLAHGCRFHGLTDKDREMAIRQIEDWWKEAQSKSVADGIRIQLPHADFHEKLAMAKNLARLGGENAARDRRFAVEFLKQLVDEPSEQSIQAARILADLGDLSPVETYYRRMNQAMAKGESSNYNGCMASYLTEYGGEREWLLMNRLARAEMDHNLDSTSGSRVWVELVTCRKAGSSLLAVPSLALALSQTKQIGMRLANQEPQGFSYADMAIERMQKLTGVDFNYRPAASASDRAEAIRKAQAWWEKDGIRKYSLHSP